VARSGTHLVIEINRFCNSVCVNGIVDNFF
jgi:hypothetical protein